MRTIHPRWSRGSVRIVSRSHQIHRSPSRLRSATIGDWGNFTSFARSIRTLCLSSIQFDGKHHEIDHYWYTGKCVAWNVHFNILTLQHGPINPVRMSVNHWSNWFIMSNEAAPNCPRLTDERARWSFTAGRRTQNSRPLIQQSFPSPSAGIGRTGCYIALSNGIKQLNTEHEVDVVRILCNLRRDRGGMVQTNDQYQFLYQALSAHARTLSWASSSHARCPVFFLAYERWSRH